MQVIKIKAVIQQVKLGRTTIYRMMAEGTFPKSIPLTGRSVGWLKQEIDQWIAEQAKTRNENTEPNNQ